MDRELTRAELDELLPLFALDALDGEEREQVARYVERDDTARAEVLSLREAASLLPRADVRAPSSLWANIETSLDAPASSARPLPVLRMRRVAPHPARRVAVVCAAAAAVVAIAVLGVQITRQQDRIDDLASAMHGDAMHREAMAALGSKDAHLTQLASTGGKARAQIVMLPDGTGYLLDHQLPKLPTDATYQLWAKVGDATQPRMVSLGVLGTDPGIVGFRLAAEPSLFEITEEPASGSTSPSESVVMRSETA
jgi:anti-sigma-K factor RskA